ncbi:hypothetical protein CNR22_18670 [Sphingobacteriaceae bacterium]|nr:hypothetical protein CNR22_18670 [Sphingobacteriaceae bacterium]
MVTIQKGMKISTVQKLFNTAFPFLKIEFFKNKKGLAHAHAKKDALKNDFILWTDQQTVEQQGVALNENMSVGAVEQLFIDYFGLSAQVLRKSGISWLETSMTEDWTLKKQNEEGLELSGYKHLDYARCDKPM